MRQVFNVVSTVARLIFEILFTYLMFVLLGMGFSKILWVGVLFGVIGIAFGMYEVIKLIGDNPQEEMDASYLIKEKPPLYYEIHEVNEFFYFVVKSQNHEEICESDLFNSRHGAITGLWYLMDSMKKMNETNWVCRSN